MLTSILDAKITKKFVRLGSRSTDERIAEYSLRNLEKTSTDTSMSRQIGREYVIKKKIEREMYKVMEDIQIPEPSEDQIQEYLQTGWAEHLSMMYDPPFWIAEYATRLWESESKEGDWKVQGKKGKGKEPSHLMARTYYGLWKRGLDIAFILPPQPQFAQAEPQKKQKQKQRRGQKQKQKQKQTQEDVQPSAEPVPPSQKDQEMYQKRMLEFFSELGFGDSVPPVPSDSRPFVQLQDSPAVWAMSLEERQRLAEYWEEEMRRLAYNDHLEEYESLREVYEDACEKYQAVTDEVRF